MTINCALDGPGGAGKSTIAKAVSKELQYVYVDTGALYRAIGLYCRRREIDPADADKVVPELSGINLELRYIDGGQRVLLNGEDVSDKIRTNEISMAASKVSALPEVREFLLELQRDIAGKNNIIMDGRDIGTVILPNAQVKIFLTASAEKRADRRYKELLEKGQDISYEKVLADINERDYNDSHREAAPLKQAEDAVLLDTSDLTLEQSVAAVIAIIKDKTGGAARSADGDGLPKNDGCGGIRGEKKDIVKRARTERGDLEPEMTEKKKVSGARVFLYGIVRIIIGCFFHVIYDYRLIGKENVPKDGSYIVAPNHIHWADPFFVAVGIKNPSSYMAKESLFKNKFLAFAVRLFNAFPVKRESSDRSALNTAVKYLNNGYNLTIFPEGTRSKDGKIGKGKSGVAYIASVSGADVLPVGIVMKKGRGLRKKVTVRYGRLIPNASLKINALSANELRRARDIIMTEIEGLVEQ